MKIAEQKSQIGQKRKREEGQGIAPVMEAPRNNQIPISPPNLQNAADQKAEIKAAEGKGEVKQEIVETPNTWELADTAAWSTTLREDPELGQVMRALENIKGDEFKEFKNKYPSLAKKFALYGKILLM